MFPSLLALPMLLGASSVVAQSSPVILCVAGQCLQGVSNTTLGVKLSAPGDATTLQLLPDHYTTTAGPNFLDQFLASPSAVLTPFPGFSSNSSSVTLPLTVALQPGLAVYPTALYSGQASLTPLPATPPTTANSSAPLSGRSLLLSSNVYASVSSGNSRIVLWDSIPDFTQLPAGTTSNALSLLSVESSSCSSPCASSGLCSAEGTCVCRPGFTGASCETCASGFFGPTCQPCPSGCASCDDGISGSGKCLRPVVTNAPATCNCLNGVCASGGQCTCNAGWTTAANGTACAKCLPGFFQTAAGDCAVCATGCVSCQDITGNCVTCKTNFDRSVQLPQQCIPPQGTNAQGSQCPSSTFSNGQTCVPCSANCQTCSGATSSDCIVCASGTFLNAGACVSVDVNGVCTGTNLVANNAKNQCDACPAQCTSCKYPTFSSSSTTDQLQCTGCLPGLVLSGGKCVSNCPTGTFLSPQDNLTCTPCSTSCGTCVGSSTFCLTCGGGLLASSGQCLSTCPSNSFSASATNGTCTTCHPDCTTCTGPSFAQCSSCPPDRPVLSNGRCLPTCAKGQFFDSASASCRPCDSSCSSCSDVGNLKCLGCASSTQVLRGGQCVNANCQGTPTVATLLGICLSSLVTGTGGTAPPTVTGVSLPAPRRQNLAWWQILLMALGCAFIFLVILMLWRRRARQQRQKQTAMFVRAKDLEGSGWGGKMRRFREWLFGGYGSRREPVDLVKLRDLEEERHHREMEKILGAGALAHSGSTRTRRTEYSTYDNDRRNSGLSESLYSQITGETRRVPEPRMPVKRRDMPRSRFSTSSMGSEPRAYVTRRVSPPVPTEEELEEEGREEGDAVSSETMGSKNPFRR